MSRATDGVLRSDDSASQASGLKDTSKLAGLLLLLASAAQLACTRSRGNNAPRSAKSSAAQHRCIAAVCAAAARRACNLCSRESDRLQKQRRGEPRRRRRSSPKRTSQERSRRSLASSPPAHKNGRRRAAREAPREDLEKACKAQKFSKILKKANEVLNIDGEDADAKRCKAVALAKLDRCKEGLECCGDDEALQDVKAYCQYQIR